MTEAIYKVDNVVAKMDDIPKHLKKLAEEANKEVSDAIEALKKTGADNPAALADLQHKINKWSVVFGLNSSIVRAWKDLMQGIIQKI